MEEDESTHRPTSKPLSVSSRLLVLRVNRPEANPPPPSPPPPHTWEQSHHHPSVARERNPPATVYNHSKHSDATRRGRRVHRAPSPTYTVPKRSRITMLRS